jgi:hypothetical protein
MRSLAFIRSGLSVSLLVADSVEDILPKLREAARPVSESEKLMEAGTAERL